MSSDNESSRENPIWVTFFLWASFLAGTLFFATGLYVFDSSKIEKYSNVGEYIGGTAGSLWALASVVLICLSLRSQQKQMNEQSLQLRRQSFENTFFQLLRLHGQIVAQTDTYKSFDQKVTGHDAFKAFYGKLEDEYDELLREKAKRQLPQEDIAQARRPQEKPYDQRALERERSQQIGEEAKSVRENLTGKERREMAQKAYAEFYGKHQYEVGHYFRNLYHIIKFVKEADDQVVKDKRDYTNIVRAQLSSSELLLLAHNGLMHGKEKFKPMMEEYGFLKQMPRHEITDPIRAEYDEAAFQGRSSEDERVSV